MDILLQCRLDKAFAGLNRQANDLAGDIKTCEAGAVEGLAKEIEDLAKEITT